MYICINIYNFVNSRTNTLQKQVLQAEVSPSKTFFLKYIEYISFLSLFSQMHTSYEFPF